MSKSTDGVLLDKVLGISKDKLSKYAFFSVLIWVLSPILIMPFNASGLDAYNIYAVWIFLLYIAGGFGVIFGATILLQEYYESKLSQKDKIKSMLPLILMVLFFLWCIFCVFFAPEKRIAIYGYGTMRNNIMTYFFYGCMVVTGYAVSKQKKNATALANVFLLVAVALSVLALLNNGLTELLCNNDYTDRFGYESVFYNSNHYGYYLLLSVLVSAYMTCETDAIWKKLLYLASYVLLLNTLILNNTLGAYLAVAISLIFALVMDAICKRKKKTWILLVAFVIVSAASNLYTNNVITNFASFFGDTNLLLSDPEHADGAGSGRIEIWKAALAYIHERPIVGFGPQNLIFSAHNNFLEIGVYTGVPGMLLYLAFLLSGFLKLLKNSKKLGSIAFVAMCVALGYIASAFLGVTMFYTAPYFYIVLGLCLSGCLNPLVDIE